jgi:Uma2 family endonuclease
MSPLLEATQRPDGRSQLFRMSVEFYHELGRLGMLSEKGWELLDGIIVERMPKSPLHEYLTNMLVQLLGQVLGIGVFVCKEQSLSTRHSEPIPDVVVLKGQPIDYALQHPHTALLVMEVSVTSEKIDLAKSAIYADAGVAEYWIINPTEDWIEVHSKPAGDSYAKQERFAASELVTSQSVPAFALRLADIMPNQSTAA